MDTFRLLLRWGEIETGGCLVGILQGRKGLILGVANEKSIAWGVARACHREGAELGFNYLGEALKKTGSPPGGVDPVELCRTARRRGRRPDRRFLRQGRGPVGRIDFIVHSIAFANRESLVGNFRDTSRSDFHRALDISAYSFIACAGGRPG